VFLDAGGLLLLFLGFFQWVDFPFSEFYSENEIVLFSFFSNKE
jgi:hypothetical protein